MNNWTEHDDMSEDIRAWNRRCLKADAVVLAIVAMVIGGAIGIALWRFVLAATVGAATAVAVWLW